MARSLVERQLSEVAARLSSLREELRVVDEQLRVLTAAAEDAHLRALVSETPLADREHMEARRHADAMARHHQDLLTEVVRLEQRTDDLLDRLAGSR